MTKFKVAARKVRHRTSKDRSDGRCEGGRPEGATQTSKDRPDGRCEGGRPEGATQTSKDRSDGRCERAQ